ncbi:acyl-CoA reductase-like NAD-dependent aldehyde dehydrogenase [Roseimicrobium gellanilyticum]|uniref:Acyl-CoA reductase-like NAD-dependent aldehyde dehydrogenase n=1 Tax=Roseimicrobium gellanilyticum TaxID=748857 RepID=A0A366HI69_9BACT|nr:aldehyde dehydrogenase family protein [Roseimicrobium gellanilyticum]RBP42446.1 acyl-CoA reductase-like NAD-dependent aldehyde dehydrogenase [Roseimicrobium gellanilyticum]
MKPVLLLVDLQRDYLDAPGLEPSAGQLIHECSRLLNACRARGIPVIHIWTSVSRERDERMPHWKAADRWRCEVGTPGHAPPASLAPQPGEHTVHKTGFSPFTKPELGHHLAEGGFDHAIIAGVHLHACVRETILGAYERGMTVWVADGATGSDDPLHAAITRRYLGQRGIRFASVADISAMLECNGTVVTAARPAIIPTHTDIPVPRPASEGMNLVPMAERAHLLETLARQLEHQAHELARAMADEIGKPVYHGEREVRHTAAMLRKVMQRAADDAATNHGDAPEVRHRPLGTVAIVTPWNNPFYIPLSKIAPALLYGNTVAWKPSPLAPGIARRVIQMLQESRPDLPLPSILTLVEGGREAAAQLMNHPGIHAVTLTGSLETGFSAHEICARRHLPFQAELGGNNAALVWEDADLPEAARLIAKGAFAQAGQRCTANRRVIVHTSCKDAFLSHLQQETRRLCWGDPLQESTRIGPMVTPAHCERFRRLLDRAETSGGTLTCPQEEREPHPSWGHEGAWHPPAIISCDNPRAEVVQHESFGPLLVMQTANRWDEAISLLNGVPQGLAAAVFTRSEEVTARFLADARAGILKVNQSTADAGLDLPFGGWKSSGIGPPEHGRFDREFYTRAQTVYGIGRG